MLCVFVVGWFYAGERGRCTSDDAEPSEAEEEHDEFVHVVHRAHPKVHQECC